VEHDGLVSRDYVVVAGVDSMYRIQLVRVCAISSIVKSKRRIMLQFLLVV